MRTIRRPGAPYLTNVIDRERAILRSDVGTPDAIDRGILQVTVCCIWRGGEHKFSVQTFPILAKLLRCAPRT